MDRKIKIYGTMTAVVVAGAVVGNLVIRDRARQFEDRLWMKDISNTQPIDFDDVTGPPEFMAKWNKWKRLSEAGRAVFLAPYSSSNLPNTYEYYLKLIAVTDDGLTLNRFRKWVFLTTRQQLPITKSEKARLETNGVMLDCRNYVFNEDLKTAIQKAEKLTWLRLPGKIEKSDFEWLVDLKQLKGLGLGWQDNDLQFLSEFQNLKWLEVSQHYTYEHYLDEPPQLLLPSLPELEYLSMTGDGISDGSMPRPGQFPKLKSLDVSSSMISDKGVAEISQNCSGLVFLDMGWCERISYDCVSSLSKLKALRYLYLNHTPNLERRSGGMRYGTIPELQLKLPHCAIRIGER